ncbi:MAG: PIN domain-containing protein [Burkholderiaceae bacterium]|nr:PIN domain-containing protein [Burkholderiaceae bacterium]
MKVTSGQLRFLGLLFGVGNLPDGKRKQALNHALNELFDLFDGRVLPFDIVAARRYAELAVRARNIGKGLPTPDGYIAAIAAAKGFLVATRDTSPFEAAGVTVLNPWTSAC